MIINVNRSITKSRELNDNEKVSSFERVIAIEKIYRNRLSISRESTRQQKEFALILLEDKKIDKD